MASGDSVRVEKLLGDLSQCHELFNESDAENTSLRAKVKKYRDRWRKATDGLGGDGEYNLSEDEDDEISEIDAVRAQLQNAHGRIEKLESNIREREKHEKFKPVRAEVSEEDKALRKQVSNRDTRIAALEGQIRRLQQHALDVEKPENEKISELAKLRGNLEDCHKMVKHIETEIAASNQQPADFMNARLTHVEQQLQVSSAENEQLTVENDSLRESFEHIRTAGAQLAATHQRTLADIAELRAASQQLQAHNSPPLSPKIGRDTLHFQALVNYQQANIAELERIIHHGFARRDQTSNTHPDHLAQVKDQEERTEVAKREAEHAARILFLEQEVALSQRAEGALQDKISQLEGKLADLSTSHRQQLEQDSTGVDAHNYQHLEEQMQLTSNELDESRNRVQILRAIIQVAQDRGFRINFHNVDAVGHEERMSIEEILERDAVLNKDVRRLLDERTDYEAIQAQNQQLSEELNGIREELIELRRPKPTSDENTDRAGQAEVEDGVARSARVRSMMTREELAQYSDIERWLELQITTNCWGTPLYNELLDQQATLENQVLTPARLDGIQKIRDVARVAAGENDVDHIRRQRDHARSENAALQNRIDDLTLAAGEWTRNAERIEHLEEGLRNAMLTPHDLSRYNRLRATAAIIHDQASLEAKAALAAVQEFQEGIFFPPPGTSRKVESEPTSGSLYHPTNIVRAWIVTFMEHSGEFQNMRNLDMQALIDEEGGFETLSNFFDLSPLSVHSVPAISGTAESPDQEYKTMFSRFLKFMGSNTVNDEAGAMRSNVDKRSVVQIEPAPRGNRNDDRNSSQHPNSSLSKDSFASARADPGEDMEMSDAPQASSKPSSLAQLQAVNEQLQGQVNNLVEQRDELLASRLQQQIELNARTQQLAQTEALVTIANIEVARFPRELNQTKDKNVPLSTRVETLENQAARRINLLLGDVSGRNELQDVSGDNPSDNTEATDGHAGDRSHQGGESSSSQGNTGSANHGSNQQSASNHNSGGSDRLETILDGYYENDPCYEVIVMFLTQLYTILHFVTGELPPQTESPRRAWESVRDALGHLKAENNRMKEQNRADALRIAELGLQLGQAIVDRQDRQKQIEHLRQQAQHASPKIREYIIKIATKASLLSNNNETNEVLATDTAFGDLRQLEYQLDAILENLQKCRDSERELQKRNFQFQADNEELRGSLARCKAHGKQLSLSVDELRQRVVEEAGEISSDDQGDDQTRTSAAISLNSQLTEIVHALQTERDDALLSRVEATAQQDALQLDNDTLTFQRNGLREDLANERADKKILNAYPLHNQERQKLQDEIYALRGQIAETRKEHEAESRRQKKHEKRLERLYSTMAAQLNELQVRRDNLRRVVVHYGGIILNDGGEVMGELVGAHHAPPLYPRPSDPREGFHPTNLTNEEYHQINFDRNIEELYVMQRMATQAGVGVDNPQRGHFMNAIREAFPEPPREDARSQSPPAYDPRDRIRRLSAILIFEQNGGSMTINQAISFPDPSAHSPPAVTGGNNSSNGNPPPSSPNGNNSSNSNPPNSDSSSNNPPHGNQDSGDQGRDGYESPGEQGGNGNEDSSENQHNDGNDERGDDAGVSPNSQHGRSNGQSGDSSSSNSSNDSSFQGPHGERRPTRRSGGALPSFNRRSNGRSRSTNSQNSDDPGSDTLEGMVATSRRLLNRQIWLGQEPHTLTGVGRMGAATTNEGAPPMLGAELIRRAQIIGITPIEYAMQLHEQALRADPNDPIHAQNREGEGAIQRRRSDEEFPSRNPQRLGYEVPADTQEGDLPQGYELAFDGDQYWAVPNQRYRLVNAPEVDMDDSPPGTPSNRGHLPRPDSSPEEYGSSPVIQAGEIYNASPESFRGLHQGASPTRQDSNPLHMPSGSSSSRDLLRDDDVEGHDFDGDDNLSPAFQSGKDAPYGSEGNQLSQQESEQAFSNNASKSNNLGHNPGASPQRLDLPSYGDDYEEGPCAAVINRFRDRIRALLSQFDGERVGNQNPEQTMARLEVNVQVTLREVRTLARQMETIVPRVRQLERENRELKDTIERLERQLNDCEARVGDPKGQNVEQGEDEHARVRISEIINMLQQHLGKHLSDPSPDDHLHDLIEVIFHLVETTIRGESPIGSPSDPQNYNSSSEIPVNRKVARDLSNCRETVGQLETEIERIKKDLADITTERDLTKATLEACKQSGKTKDKRLGEIEKKQRSETEKDKKNTTLEKELADRNRRITELEQQLGATQLQKDLTSVKLQNCLEASRANDGRHHTINRLSAANASLMERLAKLEEELASMTTERDAWEGKLKDCQEKRSQLKKFAQPESQKDERIVQLEKNLAACQTQLKNCKATCLGKDRNFDEMQEEYDNAQGNIDRFNRNIVELREEVVEVQALIANITTQQQETRANHKIKIAGLRSQLREAQMERDNFRQQRDNLNQPAHQAMRDMANLLENANQARDEGRAQTAAAFSCRLAAIQGRARAEEQTDLAVRREIEAIRDRDSAFRERDVARRGEDNQPIPQAIFEADRTRSDAIEATRRAREARDFVTRERDEASRAGDAARLRTSQAIRSRDEGRREIIDLRNQLSASRSRELAFIAQITDIQDRNVQIEAPVGEILDGRRAEPRTQDDLPREAHGNGENVASDQQSLRVELPSLPPSRPEQNIGAQDQDTLQFDTPQGDPIPELASQGHLTPEPLAPFPDGEVIYSPVGSSPVPSRPSPLRPAPPPADGRSVSEIRSALNSIGGLTPLGRGPSAARPRNKRSSPREDEDEDGNGNLPTLGSPTKRRRKS